jgi:hypothetical protein
MSWISTEDDALAGGGTGRVGGGGRAISETFFWRELVDLLLLMNFTEVFDDLERSGGKGQAYDMKRMAAMLTGGKVESYDYFSADTPGGICWACSAGKSRL